MVVAETLTSVIVMEMLALATVIETLVSSLFVTGMDVKLDSPEWADVNIVTGCLKLFLRELPDPLVPFSSFRSFIDCTSK